jgi:hypothetical protein
VLVEAAWVLREVQRRIQPRVYLDWNEFATAGSGLFLWEAFVTGTAKTGTHVDDAVLAVSTFCASLPDPRKANAVSEPEVLSLIGAAALWAGLSDDTTLLSAPCLVLRASPEPDTLIPPS